MEVISNIPDYDGIGVYSITDTETGKTYIGSSKNVKKRIIQHAQGLKKGRGNKALCKAYEQGHMLKCEILEKIPWGVNTYFLLDRERFFIERTPRKELMNIAPPVSTTEKGGLWLVKNTVDNDLALSIYTKKSQPIMPQTPKKEREEKAKYYSEHYETISLVIPKDKKAAIKAFAESQGKSLNGFIKEAIDEKIERDTGKKE